MWSIDDHGPTMLVIVTILSTGYVRGVDRPPDLPVAISYEKALDEQCLASKDLSQNEIAEPPQPEQGTATAKEAQFQIIHGYYKASNWRAAYDAWIAFQANYPDDTRNKEIREMLCSIYPDATHGRDQGSEIVGPLDGCLRIKRDVDLLWKQGLSLFEENRFADAQIAFQTIMLMHPMSKYVAQAYVYNAECYCNLHKFKQARAAFESYYSNYPMHSDIENVKRREQECYLRKE